MHTLNVDDQTYALLEQQAAAAGLDVESWIRHYLVDHAAAHNGVNGRSVEELTVEERLERLQKLHTLTADHGGHADFSRDTIYD